MGAPIKHRKKYISHKQRWNKQTIIEEAVLVKDYALKNKKEIRKIEFKLSKIKKQAKLLNSNDESKNSDVAKNFIEKLKQAGFLNIDANSLDEVLDINIRNILDRRLSNVLYKNKLARTPAQARQFIVHRHVRVNGKVISSPSYLVTLAEEPTIDFKDSSSLTNEEHPERKLAAGGYEEVLEEAEKQKEVPKEDKSNFDEKEQILDDQEQDEVIE